MITDVDVTDIELFDVLGRPIFGAIDDRIIDLNNQSPGIYFIRYKLENKINSTKLLRH